MHIHPPKPLHGWKEFLNEIFVIVIGVLIALGFEQVVEELHWQHKVHEGEERLKVELSTDYFAAILMAKLAPCHMSRLKDMEDRVLKSGATLIPTPALPLTPREAILGRPAKVINLGGVRPSADIYTALGNEGTLLHMPKNRQQRLAAVYSQVSQFNAQSDMYRDLDVLTLPIPLDPSTKHDLLADIKSMERTIDMRAQTAANMASHIREVGFARSDSDVEQFLKDLKSYPLDQCIAEGRPIGDWKAMINLAPSLKRIGI